MAVVAVVATGCGGGDGPGSGKYAALCQVACAPPADGPCASASVDACRTQCEGYTETLADACARCVIERSGWSGSACTCYGSNCTLCGVGPESAGCSSPAPGETCEAAMESCDGFTLAPTTSGDCAGVCGAPPVDAAS